MTNETSQDNTPTTDAGSGDTFNTVAGWVLFAAALGLGLSIVSGKYFHGNDAERPEKLGYVIEGVVQESGAVAEMSIAEALTLVTVDDGEKVFAKCQACHTIDRGGANGVGPNLHGVMGEGIAAPVAGYEFSGALQEKGGNWGWEEMNQWLKNPKAYVPGTKMGFAGLSSVEDRAAVALYLNANGDNLPLPEFTPAPTEEAAPADGVEDAAAEDGAAEDAAADSEGADAEAEAAPAKAGA